MCNIDDNQPDVDPSEEENIELDEETKLFGNLLKNVFKSLSPRQRLHIVDRYTSDSDDDPEYLS